MRIRVFLLLPFLIVFISGFAQLQSPRQFLGYELGDRYTPHWQVVAYFRHVAAQAPNVVKLQDYGKTNEGRPLLLAFVGTAENIRRLEEIRVNNLRIAYSTPDRAAPSDTNAPAFVWLSYNVHGNETSSTEVAMRTLYALVDPSQVTNKTWLRNTLVIIDPCINPDGRDRYVNWFNSVVGDHVNYTPGTREHVEPWPGGRTNHYYFDLNRDWSWQTQVETEQRLKVYNQWLPHVHVDYHEQGINAPYYFAPAAEPYHDVITPFQREFQVAIGKNHAKYFDREGWLYFTREIFDLYYPAYGDTYPTYTGAIGMTYEQGGGSVGGIGVINSDNDTLTLKDRIDHHFTTSLSTIEIASQNAAQLVREFRKYFSDAVTNGVGPYKTYIIRNLPGDQERINALRDLLDKNLIRYGTASGSGRGYNFTNGKEESFTIGANDIVITGVQPRSALIKVLFEPKPQLPDSNTYDITAWSLPYVYGLSAFATSQRFNISGEWVKAAPLRNQVNDSYGYVIRWQGMQSAKVLATLLQKGIRVRVSEVPFEMGGQKFERGSLIVLRSGNVRNTSNLSSILNEAANKNNVQIFAVSTGMVDKGGDFGSSKVQVIQPPKVAIISGDGTSTNNVGELWHYFDRELDYPVSLINERDLRFADWQDHDVIILPDGNFPFLNDKARADQLRDWVNRGGTLISMERAVAQLARTEWGIKSRKQDTSSDKSGTYDALQVFENREREGIAFITPGSIYRVELDHSHPMAFGYPRHYYTLRQDDNVYDFIKEGGWNVGVIKKQAQVAGFVGSKLQSRLQDGLIFGVQNMGRGKVVYFADNPIFRGFWENGKLMVANAVFMVGLF